MSGRPMVPRVLVRDPFDPDVSAIAPGRWEDLDDLVARRGAVFAQWGHEFDIGPGVAELLGTGKVALLVLADPSAPRPPIPEEAAILGIPMAE